LRVSGGSGEVLYLFIVLIAKMVPKGILVNSQSANGIFLTELVPMTILATSFGM